MSRRRPSRAERMTIVTGMLAFAILIVVLQLWLLTATMNAYLGGDTAVVVPAALASLACLGLNLGLLRYLYRLESTGRRTPSGGPESPAGASADRLARP